MSAKKIIILSCLIFCSQFIYSQNTTTTCDTLRLLNERVMSVYIDSIENNIIYYKKCPDTTNRQYIMPRSYLADIQTKKSFEKRKEKIKIEKLLSVDTLSEQSTKKWLFKHKTQKKLTRILEKGVRVKVRYLDDDRKRKEKGRLISLSENSLILENTRKEIVEINNDYIVKISIRRKYGILGSILGIFLIGVALSISALVMIAQAFIGEGFNEAASDTGLPGCLGLVLIVAVAIGAIALTRPKVIKNPFSGDWEIQETIESKENSNVYKMP